MLNISEAMDTLNKNNQKIQTLQLKSQKQLAQQIGFAVGFVGGFVGTVAYLRHQI